MRTADNEQARRTAPCRKVRGREHFFIDRGRIGDWSVCQVCGVTETDADWTAREEHFAFIAELDAATGDRRFHP